MKLKNILITAASCALTAAIAVGGTLAYLTSTDSDVNVMTNGNVKIAQHEYQRKTDGDGNYVTKEIDGQTSYVLEDFEQGKDLLPIVGDPSLPGNDSGYAGYDSIPVRMSQVDSYGGMDVFAGKNAQDKFVTVENTGESGAFIRTLVAIECGSTNGALVGSSYHKTWTKNSIGIITIDNNNYYLTEYVYAGAQLSDGSWRHENGVLPAGDTSYPNLSQVYIKSEATNEDMVALDGNNNDTLDILVLSQAVQTEGFANAEEALNAGFPKGANNKNIATWFSGMGDVQFVEAGEKKAQVLGEDAAEMLDSLEEGNDLIVDKDMDLLGFDTNKVDANGANVTLNGVGPEAYGYLAFLPDAGEDVTVSNLNVTGSGFVEVGHYGMGGGNYELNNVKIENLGATLKNGNKGYNLACAFMANGDVVLNDCVFTGTTAVQDGAMAVDLACGQAWTGYKDDNDNKVSTTVNDGEFGTVYCWEHSIATFDGADIDTLYVAPIRGAVTIKAGTHIGTLNVDYGTSQSHATAANLAKLVIEEGSIVDSIVYSGNTYTVEAWNAYVDSL